MDESRALKDQDPQTCIIAENVRPFDNRGKMRMGQRPGIVKFSSAQVNDGSTRVQMIAHVVTIDANAASGTTIDRRTIKLVAIANTKLNIMTPTSSTEAATHVLTFDANAPVIFSTKFYDDLYIFDGIHNYFYDTSADAIIDAAATETGGSVPVNGSDAPKLCCTWGGRLVVSGIDSDPHNWFMSAMNDPLNWNYSPTVLVETMAVAGNSADAAQIGDQITCLLPYNNDLLWIGCDHSIWQLTGQPLVGGRFDLVTDTVGMAWGEPYAKDDRGGVYYMTPGEQPKRITAQNIESRLLLLDMDATLCRMAWDDVRQGLNVWITPLTSSVAEHWWYDRRTDGWFRVEYGSKDYNPVAVHVFDGDSFEDREGLTGSGTGYIMKQSDGATNDESDAIYSFIRIGPIQVNEGNGVFVLKSLQAVLSEGSSAVAWRISAGNSAMDALANAANSPGSVDQSYLLNEDGTRFMLETGNGFLLTQGGEDIGALGEFRTGIRSVVEWPRVRAFAFYIDLFNETGSETWSIEQLIASISVIGTSKGRRM